MLHFIGKAIIAFVFAVVFCGVFLFRGRKAFEIVDNFLEKYDLADIERG